jgi:hypothetical protein
MSRPYTLKEKALLRRWDKILKSKQHMEELVLKLMANPDTEAEHMVQVHAMYADVCRTISEVSNEIVEALQQSKPLQKEEA